MMEDDAKRQELMHLIDDNPNPIIGLRNRWYR